MSPLPKTQVLPSFKILSIDGGGIRGLAAAMFLKKMEDHTGKRINELFDMIVGTSTGGIIAVGLASGMTAQQLVTLYEKNGDHIFQKQWRIGATYTSEGLRELLELHIDGYPSSDPNDKTHYRKKFSDITACHVGVTATMMVDGNASGDAMGVLLSNFCH